jgi:hypothetical protein
MQEKIQELLPNINKNFFANTLKNHIENAEEDQKFVISDLRFIHEYEMLANIQNIEHKDKVIIRVIRPSNNRIRDENPHISEIEYTNIPYDIIMINNGTIDEYISRFEKLIRI